MSDGKIRAEIDDPGAQADKNIKRGSASFCREIQTSLGWQAYRDPSNKSRGVME